MKALAQMMIMNKSSQSIHSKSTKTSSNRILSICMQMIMTTKMKMMITQVKTAMTSIKKMSSISRTHLVCLCLLSQPQEPALISCLEEIIGVQLLNLQKKFPLLHLDRLEEI